MPFRRFPVSLLAFALSVSCCLAQDNAAPTPPSPASAQAPELTLEACIARAMQKNFDLAAGRYNPQIAKDSIDIAQGNFDPVLTASGNHGATSTGAVNGYPAASSHSSDLRVGASQLFSTGTTVSVSSSLDRNTTNPASVPLAPAYAANTTVSVRQSLLSGFGSAVNKAATHRAEIGLARADLDFKTQALNVIQNTEVAYYNLAFAREQLAVFKLSLDLANRLYDEAKTRRDTGVATNLDVLQAQVGVANARRNVVLAAQTAQDRQDALLALIGQFELDSSVGTVRFPEVENATPVFASSFLMAEQSQPDYLSAKAAIDQYKLDVVVAKDAAKPDLSVGVAVGLDGTNNAASNTFGDSLSGQGHSWQVDFTYSYPWGQKSNKARYRQATATLNQQEVLLRQTEQNIAVQVRSAVRSVETGVEDVKIAALSAELSQKQYEFEKARFDAGLSTSYLVLQAQNDLDTAQVNLLQARVALNTAISTLHRIEGSSLQRYGISLP